MGSPWRSSGRTPHFHCRGRGATPGQGVKTLHTTQRDKETTKQKYTGSTSVVLGGHVQRGKKSEPLRHVTPVKVKQGSALPSWFSSRTINKHSSQSIYCHRFTVLCFSLVTSLLKTASERCADVLPSVPELRDADALDELHSGVSRSAVSREFRVLNQQHILRKRFSLTMLY